MMKRIALSLALALLFAGAANAQQVISTHADLATVNGKTGTLTNVNDTVTLAISGAQWATAKFTVNTAGTATATAQVSNDGGKNWLAAPYAKRLDLVAANPTVQAITATTLVTGQIWEVPLPGNCTNFQLLAAAGGTANTITVAGSLPYVPGVPVVAVLYDVTEGSIGAGLATGTLDMTGWGSAQIQFGTPTTQVWTDSTLDDAGAVIGPSFVTTAAGSSSVELSQSAAANVSATVSNGAFSAYPFGEKRFKLVLPAGGTITTGRARVTARR